MKLPPSLVICLKKKKDIYAIPTKQNSKIAEYNTRLHMREGSINGLKFSSSQTFR